MEIGKIIKQCRLEKGLSLMDVAKRCDVSKATVARWENGDIKEMRRDKIENLSHVLGLSPITLITGELPRNDKTISALEFIDKVNSLIYNVRDLETLDKQQIMNYVQMTVEYKAMKKDASTHKLGVDNNRQM